MTAMFLPPRVPLVDIRTGTITREWYLLLQSLFGSNTSGDTEDFGPSAGVSADQIATILDRLSSEMQLVPPPVAVMPLADDLQPPPAPLFIAADDVLPAVTQLLDRIAMLEKRINEMAQGVFIL